MTLQRAVLSVLIGLGLLTACGDTAAPSPRANSQQIVRADLGSKWPFMVEGGTLRCDLGAVTFAAGGKTYALNGTARNQRAERGWHEAEPILADDPVLVKTAERDGGYAKMSTQPLIDSGLKLCGPPYSPAT